MPILVENRELLRLFVRLVDDVVAIDRQVGQDLRAAEGPADLHAVHAGGGAEPEEQARVVRGVVGRAGVELARLPERTGADRDAGADGAAVAPGADKAKADLVQGVAP